jgi:hypothetical protein
LSGIGRRGADDGDRRQREIPVQRHQPRRVLRRRERRCGNGLLGHDVARRDDRERTVGLVDRFPARAGWHRSDRRPCLRRRRYFRHIQRRRRRHSKCHGDVVRRHQWRRRHRAAGRADRHDHNRRNRSLQLRRSRHRAQVHRQGRFGGRGARNVFWRRVLEQHGRCGNRAR